ncbi:unnamed protein product [Lactuca saligna]|uniref:Uncharacterized protein n=1 Tax=Lactuca saligna TaxID=75948 RepID=A0AA35YJS9_LACSI|nr:unnamed protein product [Lactuca saligna]
MTARQKGTKEHVRRWQHTAIASSTAPLASSTAPATVMAVVYDHYINNTHPMAEHRVLHDGRRQEEKNKKIQRHGGGRTIVLNVRRRFSTACSVSRWFWWSLWRLDGEAAAKIGWTRRIGTRMKGVSWRLIHGGRKVRR